jgi:hypothetical protein
MIPYPSDHFLAYLRVAIIRVGSLPSDGFAVFCYNPLKPSNLCNINISNICDLLEISS